MTDMEIIIPLNAWIFTLLCFINTVWGQQNTLCTVYEPFKVSPENATFQIGGPFPLHAGDCMLIRPDTVQELVAIQWALTHWNQNPAHEAYKLAMYAGDTCSRERESVSQTINFLQSAGLYEPSECANSINRPRLLGLIAPRDGSAAEIVANVLKALPVPTITYSTPAAEGLEGSGLGVTVSTAPTVQHYLQAVLHILKYLDSNLVSIVTSSQLVNEKTREKSIQYLETAGVIVRQVLEIEDLDRVQKLSESKAKIVLCFLNKNQLLELFEFRGAKNLAMLWLTIPIDGEALSNLELKTLMATPSQGSIIALQERTAELVEFKAYFLDILRNNYYAYSLLATYMQQINNCTLTNAPGYYRCQDFSEAHMEARYLQSPAVKSAVLAAYTLAVLAREITEDPIASAVCESDGPACQAKIVQILQNVHYTFDEYDPPALLGYELSFDVSNGLVLVANSLVIEGIQHGFGAEPVKVLEFETGSTTQLFISSFQWPNGEPIRSQCSFNDAECHPCTNSVQADMNRYSLSLPKPYDLYLVGLFDFHKGGQCAEPVDRADRLTPAMAFVYTLWTIQKRFPDLDLLPGFDIGGLVVDTCSGGKDALKVVMETMDKCIDLTYPGANKNITIIPPNIIGYVSSGSVTTHSSIRQLFDRTYRDTKPLISLSREPDMNGQNFAETTILPSYELEAEALVQLLRNYNWNYVTVLLSSDGVASVRSFEAFQTAANAFDICISEVMTPEFIRVAENAPDNTTTLNRIAIAFTSAEDTARFLKFHDDYFGINEKVMYVLNSNAHFWKMSKNYKNENSAQVAWESNALGAISLVPKKLLHAEFQQWLSSITPQRFPEPWFHQIVEEEFHCAMFPEHRDQYQGRMCTGDELISLKASMSRINEAGYLAQEIESLLFAVDGAYKRLCPEKGGLCDRFFQYGNAEILQILAAVQPLTKFELMNYRLQGNREKDADYKWIGEWSNSQGLRFMEPWVGYDSDKRESTTIPHSRCDPPLCRCHLDADFFKKPLQENVQRGQPTILQSSYADIVIPSAGASVKNIQRSPIRAGNWKNQTWAYIFIAINSLLLLIAICILLLICIKLYYRVIKGNQGLGICLLCGVILLYITGFFFIFDPSEHLCQCRYFFHGSAYALCFGVMIAKAMQLRNSENVGFNGFISYWNYWLLLFFIVAVQVSLNAQWILLQSPVRTNIFHNGELIPVDCNWSRHEFLVSQSYVILLLLLMVFIALLNRSVKRNFKETKWLLSSALTSIPIWLAWMICYALIPHPFQDTIIVMELITCATVILCFMFGPKIYILLSYEPVLIEYPPGYKISPVEEAEEPGGQMDFFGQLEYEERVASPDTHSTAASTKSSNVSSGATSNGEHSPVFQAVVRKKSRSKRIKANPNRDELLHQRPYGQATAQRMQDTFQPPDKPRAAPRDKSPNILTAY